MATSPDLINAGSTPIDRSERDRKFFARLLLGLSVFIVFGFAQFTMRGFTDPVNAPLIVHLHGAAMLAWLGFVVSQPVLARHETLQLHRRLGWIAFLLAIAVPILAIATCVTAMQRGMVPPFFTNSYFLTLVTLESLAFLGLVIAAVAARRRTDWHRRFIVGSTILILEPALGRLLPTPLIGATASGMITLLVQIGAFAILARHDHRTLGHVHRASWIALAAVIVTRLLVETLALTAPAAALAEAIG